MMSSCLQVAFLCLAFLVVLQGYSIHHHRSDYDARISQHGCSWSPTYTLWSNWGSCTAVHSFKPLAAMGAPAPCGPGKRIRYRQRDLTLSTPRFSHLNSYQIDRSHCRAKCFGKEMFQIESCVVPTHAQCYGPFATCKFEGVTTNLCTDLQSTTTLYDAVITPSTLDANNQVISIKPTTGAGTEPFAYYGLGDVFPPTFTYKYCLTYKAKLDVGTILYIVKRDMTLGGSLPVPTSFLYLEALTGASHILSGSSCNKDEMLQCIHGSTKTANKLATFSLEITTEKTFLLGFIIVPQLTTDLVGFTGAELDDIGVAQGPC